MKDLVIGGRTFKSRFFLGTGKFASGDLLKEALAASGTELVTTALTRVHEGDAAHDDILKVIDRSKVEVMLNTSGARTAAEAVRIAKLGMVVLPYINADPVLARHCEEAGAAAVMPLGSPIGSNRGIRTRDMIEIIVEQSHVPVVVDAGIGLPSHAAEAIELGADAVLANTAVAAADDPVAMARAFGLAVQAAELALRAGPPSARATASATSPMDIFK